MSKPSILFSTTRQWNCGDEFILFGVRRLLDGLGLDYNPVIYNRHPGVTPRKYTRKHRWSRAEWLPHVDNSFILDEPGMVDYVIFAGTPEWFGGARVDPLLRYVRENKVRCAFLGVGVHKERPFSEDLVAILNEQCDLITARDPLCYEMVRSYPNSHREVCPALFSAPESSLRTAVNKVGIVIQDSATKHHSIPDDVAREMDRQFARLEEAFEVGYVAHYIDDYKLARRQGKNVLYSGYSEDFAKIFGSFDVVISTRVHGCGMSSSLGVPNAIIPHDGRYATAEGFKSHIAQPGEDLVAWIRGLDVEAKSSELIAHRDERFAAFQSLLKRHLSILSS